MVYILIGKQYLDIFKSTTIKRKMKMAFFIKMFATYIKEHGLPDVVHLHSFLAGDFALYVKEKYNIPFVVTEHLSGFARDNMSSNDLDKAKNVYESSDYNIAVSMHFRNLLQDKFSLDFNYIPNIVNLEFFTIKNTVKKDTYDFINIALLDKNKNQDMLIRAFSRAFKKDENIKLTIVGDGVEYNNLDDLIKKLNMKDQISLFGRASRDEVKMLLQNSDAFVLSSQYETFGVVVIEAMACGLPVVATKCGGPESIITSDKLGLLSEIDKSQFSEKLLEMYDRRMNFDSRYIRDYIERDFSEKSICAKLDDIYKKALT